MCLACLLATLALPCQAQTAEELRQQFKALQNELNRSLRTGQPLTGEIPAGQSTDPDMSKTEDSPREAELKQMGSALAMRSYYDARGALQARGYSMHRMIQTTQDVVDRCPIGDEGACQRFREIARCWRAIGLQCDMAWRSPDADDEPNVIVSVFFDRFGTPKVTGVQSVEGRAAEQRAAQLAAAEHERADRERESRLYINFREKLLDQGFKPAHDNGGQDGQECRKNPSPWVCNFFRENSFCLANKYCIHDWTGPQGKPFRVWTEEGVSDHISVLDAKYVEAGQ